MNKQEWERIYEQLAALNSTFRAEDPYTDKNHRGRNEDIRKKAQKQVDACMRSAISIIENNKEVSELGVNWDGLRKQKYFDYDLDELLDKILEKINSFD